MAFNRRAARKSLPEDPEILFRDYLREKRVPGLLSHQADMLRKYMKAGARCSDVAMQLPTGSGKTLVGLLIAEWQRLSKKKRVLYLCPTRQLAYQVYNMAVDFYGIKPALFVGSRRDYSSDSCHAFENLEAIAISTYSSLFNTNPYFSDPQVIVFDDAHSAENYVASFWSCLIRKTENPDLFATLLNKVKNIFPEIDYTRFEEPDFASNFTGEPWVEKLPNPLFYTARDEIRAIVDSSIAVAENSDKYKYQWQMIRDHLQACQLFFSTEGILIRPLIAPTCTHKPFAEADHRVYMSATLGIGGDLERLFGLEKIERIPAPDGWQKQVIGRRFFCFPERTLDEEQVNKLTLKAMETYPRALVLTSSLKSQKKYADLFENEIGCKVFTQHAVEASKAEFLKQTNAVAIFANRFDGIDFPEDECRLLFLTEHPRSVNLQELFIISRMGARTLFDDRIATRLVQAFGRCTRSPTDRSVVIILGDSLSRHLMRAENRSYLHPEIQSELDFGIEESKGKTLIQHVENMKCFFNNDKDWIEADSSIADSVSSFEQAVLPGSESLMEAVRFEVSFQYALWHEDYSKALENAVTVAGRLSENGLRGYRAVWNYLAGYCGFLEAKARSNRSVKYQEYFQLAIQAAPMGIPWLTSLQQWTRLGDADSEDSESSPAYYSLIIEQAEQSLADLGILKTIKFEKAAGEILKGLQGSAKAFEAALVNLGKLLGFNAKNSNEKGAPDPWWLVGKDFYIVFEAKNGGKETTVISHEWLRKAEGHRNWLLHQGIIDKGTPGATILITKSTEFDATALPQVREALHWEYDEFIEWAQTALNCLRDLHGRLYETGELFWREKARESFEKFGIFPDTIVAKLTKKSFAALKQV